MPSRIAPRILQAAGEPSEPARWLSLPAAAALLDMSPDALRRAVERHAIRAPDGGIEATIDGVRARKFGRRWRVCFSERWAPGPRR